jgi:2-keto-4-pentenoate hydratase/2-oxohepta-3-ene-1,7-dioic acid hydratase in catechol pathway
MKLVKISAKNRNAEGFLEGDVVHLATEWRDGVADEAPFELPRLDPRALAERRRRSSAAVPLASVRLALPLDPRSKILCVGANYRDHVGELRSEVPKHPAVFMKQMHALVAPEAPILCPLVSETFDYEGEIALVVGKRARHVAAADALEYVAGYCCFMDGSVREYQLHSVTVGKNFWRSGAMGPWIVPAHVVPEIGRARLVTRLNGEGVQSTTADRMIFDFGAILAYCSRWTRLEPGDVIATGTGAGVGAFRKPPRWLKPGDLVEVEVEGLGVLRNRVELETAPAATASGCED